MIDGTQLGESMDNSTLGLLIAAMFLALSIGLLGIRLSISRSRREAKRQLQSASDQQRWSQQAAELQRQRAVAEAIRRDPSLAADTSPETLQRLGESTAAILQEFQLKADVEALEARRQADLAEERRQQQQAEQRARQEAENHARRSAREAQLAAMTPRRRWLSKNRTVVIGVGILVLVVLGAAANSAANSIIEQRMEAQQAQAQAAAAARVAASKEAAAQASAEAFASVVASCDPEQIEELGSDEAALRAWLNCPSEEARDAAKAAIDYYFTYPIGSTGPGGGVIVFASKWRTPWGQFLEAAPAGWSGGGEDPQAPWCTKKVADLKVSSVLGNGASNTETLVTKCGKDSAAGLAASYSGGGMDDWFLPAADELQSVAGVEGLSPTLYWSSSGPDDRFWEWNKPVALDMGDGYDRPEVSSDQRLAVRPVRAF